MSAEHQNQLSSRTFNRHDCVVFVASCDAYSDLWAPFFKLFWKHWPDCPFRIFLGAGEKEYSDTRITTVKSGIDAPWGEALKTQLENLDATYILLMLEDFFLRRPVPTAELESALRFLDRCNGHMLRLIPRPKPSIPIMGLREFGYVQIGDPYRVSLQASLWRRSSLIELLHAPESPWEFEIYGTIRSSVFAGGFFGSWHSLLPYDHHVVEKGKWILSEARHFAAQELDCDLSLRAVMSRAEYWRYRMGKILRSPLQGIPWPQRVRLSQLIREFLTK